MDKVEDKESVKPVTGSRKSARIRQRGRPTEEKTEVGTTEVEEDGPSQTMDTDTQVCSFVPCVQCTLRTKWNS